MARAVPPEDKSPISNNDYQQLAVMVQVLCEWAALEDHDGFRPYLLRAVKACQQGQFGDGVARGIYDAVYPPGRKPVPLRLGSYADIERAIRRQVDTHITAPSTHPARTPAAP